jgi:hypothetical protein
MHGYCNADEHKRTTAPLLCDLLIFEQQTDARFVTSKRRKLFNNALNDKTGYCSNTSLQSITLINGWHLGIKLSVLCAGFVGTCHFKYVYAVNASRDEFLHCTAGLVSSRPGL